MKEKSTMPEKLELLITIVSKGNSNIYVDFLEQFDVNVQLTTNGFGAYNKFKSLWAIVPKEKDIIFSFVQEDQSDKIIKALNKKFYQSKDSYSVAFIVPMECIIGVSSYRYLANIKRNKKKDENK